MALNSHYQPDLFRDAGLAKRQITESEQQRVKELLAELMLSAIEAQALSMSQEGMGDE
jgi:hypothetical protein